MIWKINHGSGRSICRCRAPALTPSEPGHVGSRNSACAGQEHGHFAETPTKSGVGKRFGEGRDGGTKRLALTLHDDLATGLQPGSMLIVTNNPCRASLFGGRSLYWRDHRAPLGCYR